ncbi:unnamed protein product [Arabidopsis thaliana]|uniref:(thale cress) hypothetical protein n=1 Tax=Arabidopsis thaliana TaxID=3702 RepID=A0A7G2F0J9_ARATH|nr:unnamed protein product [Arabidopsis thaliana]
MDTVLMATTPPIRCLHASIPTVFRSPAIYQVSCRSSQMFSYRSTTMMSMCFLRRSDLRSRFLSTPKTTSPMRRPRFSVGASTEESSIPSNRNLIVANSVVIVALAVANRVLYKLALVPMKQYPFFMAQLTTFGYVLIYFTILYTRRRLGIVTNEMMDVPKWRFAIIGFLEALGVATGMAAAAMLPGPVIKFESGGFCLTKLLVVSLWLWGLWWLFQDTTLSGIGFLWPAVLVASAAFQAGASIIKEFVFNDAAKRLEGKSLDIFVVNSFGSGFQALFVFLLLPFLSNLKGIPFASLPSYLKDGAGCFFNTGAKISGCDGAPILPLLYIATNLAFNISLLHLVKISSAIVSSLTMMLSVPLAVYIMSKPLPYLPGGSSLSSNFTMGCIVLVLGLLLYNIPTTPTKQHTKTS